MEVVVKGRGNEAAIKAGFKEKLAFDVYQDEDVLLWWSNLCEVTNVDSECSKALVHYVVDHYVVIQVMEVFKGTGSPYKLKVYYLYHNSGHCTHNPVNWQ